jgi:hypothetical protein
VDLVASWGPWLGADFPTELISYVNKTLPNSKGSLRTSLGHLVFSLFVTNVGANDVKKSMLDILNKSYEKSLTQVAQVTTF